MPRPNQDCQKRTRDWKLGLRIVETDLKMTRGHTNLHTNVGAANALYVLPKIPLLAVGLVESWLIFLPFSCTLNRVLLDLFNGLHGLG